MDTFRPNKTKAFVAAGLQVANDKATEAIISLGAAYPTLTMTLTYIQASFGVLLAYKQDELNQFTEFLMKHQNLFTEEKMTRKEFQDGLPVWLDSYFKLRSDEKHKMAQNIFADFSSSLNMPEYPLERYDDTLEKISHAGLQFLGFIDTEIPKLKREYVAKKMYEHGNDGTIEQWMLHYGNKSLTVYIEEYISKETTIRMTNYTDGEPLVKEKEIKIKLREPFSLVESELEQLGLAVTNSTPGGWSIDEPFYALTDYGHKFMSIIKPHDIYKFVG